MWSIEHGRNVGLREHWSLVGCSRFFIIGIICTSSTLSIFVKAFLSWEFKIGYLRLPEALLILTSLLMQLIVAHRVN